MHKSTELHFSTVTCLILAALIQSHCKLAKPKEGTNKAIDPCELLSRSLSDKVFQKEFSLCDIKNDSISIFDVKNQMPECSPLIEICHKKVRIIETHTTDHKSVSDILLYRADLSKQSAKMYFWRPYSGAVVILSFKKTRDKMSIFAHEIGSF